MSKIQINLIKDFKGKYPNYSLRQVAKVTGINVSRVFRIFNGSEMKVTELEKFQSTLNRSSMSSEFMELAHNCYQNLQNDKIQHLVDEMHYNLSCYTNSF